MEQAIVQQRLRRPSCGQEKLLWQLERWQLEFALPNWTTEAEVLKCNDLLALPTKSLCRCLPGATKTVDGLIAQPTQDGANGELRAVVRMRSAR